MTITRPSDEVRQALANGVPVVALESTIFSNLGLPSPHNLDAYERCIAAVRTSGAVPAMTCVVDGVPRVGIEAHELDLIMSGSHKVAAKDLPFAVGSQLPLGVTTVSASLAIAESVGIRVFATGGIGGVHRRSEVTGDVSSDLTALAMYSVACVSAGAKAFLDLAKTLEFLETLGVPVVGIGTDRFPAFYTRDSGLPVPASVPDASAAAAVVAAFDAVGHRGGVLFAVPIPHAHELDATRLDAALQQALDDADAAMLTGPDVTPFVLGRILEATDGRSIPANLALAENNAMVAGQIAAALSSM
jgi:pseudouridine-5'-phosphate glycosidase